MHAQPPDYLAQLSATLDGYLPEITLSMFIIALVICAFMKTPGNLPRVVAVFAVVATAVVLFAVGSGIEVLEGVQGRGRSIGLSLPPFSPLLLLLGTLLALLMPQRNGRPEQYALILSVLLGSLLLVSSDSFVMTIVSLEMISLSSYLLVAGDVAVKQRAEAAWKFFVVGCAATAITIFGITYLYGDTGATGLGAVPLSSPGDLFTLGVLLTMAGFLFKTTAAPFHLWAPDVYEASPAPLVAFLSVVPKIAGIAVLSKLSNWVMAFGSRESWSYALLILPVLSVVVGTLAALGQRNVKRMMAYSSVAQAGFMLLIVASFSYAERGLLAFYLFVFIVMNFVVFLAVAVREEAVPSPEFADFSGMGYSHPVLAAGTTLGLVSLVGLPPVAGFMAKLGVFTGLLEGYEATHSSGFLLAFVVGLVATVASLFFYLKIPFYLYFRQSAGDLPGKSGLFSNLLLLILVSILVGLFFAPGVLMGR